MGRRACYTIISCRIKTCLKRNIIRCKKGAMGSVIITGATGMLGVALIDEKLKAGDTIYAVVRTNSDRLSVLPQSPQLQIVQTDLISYLDEPALPCQDGVFYHLAWDHGNRERRDDPLLQEQNIKATLDAVRWAHRSGCKRFIGAGSQAEYGSVDTVIDADTKPNPETAYGVCKLAAGILSRKLCSQYGMTHIWARIFSVYGPHDGKGTMISYAIRQFLKSERATFSSGTQVWDYLYESDAGRFLHLLGEAATTGGCYRVASGKYMQLRGFVEVIGRQMGTEELCVFSSAPSEKMLSLRADIDDLIKLTGFTPQVSFEEGIRRTIAFHRMRECNKGV